MAHVFTIIELLQIHQHDNIKGFRTGAYIHYQVHEPPAPVAKIFRVSSDRTACKDYAEPNSENPIQHHLAVDT